MANIEKQREKKAEDTCENQSENKRSKNFLAAQ